MNKKLDLYIEVEITNSPSGEFVGKKGVVTGISEDEEKIYGYGIWLPDLEIVVYVDKDGVSPTGKKFPRSDFYD